MAGKQFSVSVINLATSVSSNRIHQQTSTESTRLNLLEQRKHALSEENLAITVSEGRCCSTRRKEDFNGRMSDY